ncbi:MAG TPA: hypothetical protein VJU79_10490 [Candidatus Dormibacteraeota bacterium]|nr:hypothetical protein [Candidatus Dormibacteraeota bacterium]
MNQSVGPEDESRLPRDSTLGDLPYGGRFDAGAPDVSQPRYGWGLVASAALLAIGSVTPWAYIHGDLVHRTDIGVDISWSAPVGAAVLGALGLLIVARRGRRWVSLTALILSAIFLLIALLAEGSLTVDEANKYEVDLSDVTVAYGMWLTAAGLFGAVTFAILALIKRTATPAKPWGQRR